MREIRSITQLTSDGADITAPTANGAPLPFSALAEFAAWLITKHRSIPTVQTEHTSRMIVIDEPANVITIKSDKMSAAATMPSAFKNFI